MQGMRKKLLLGLGGVAIALVGIMLMSVALTLSNSTKNLKKQEAKQGVVIKQLKQDQKVAYSGDYPTTKLSLGQIKRDVAESKKIKEIDTTNQWTPYFQKLLIKRKLVEWSNGFYVGHNVVTANNSKQNKQAVMRADVKQADINKYQQFVNGSYPYLSPDGFKTMIESVINQVSTNYKQEQAMRSALKKVYSNYYTYALNNDELTASNVSGIVKAYKGLDSDDVRARYADRVNLVVTMYKRLEKPVKVPSKNSQADTKAKQDKLNQLQQELNGLNNNAGNSSADSSSSSSDTPNYDTGNGGN